jgi:hypothetical protein
VCAANLRGADLPGATFSGSDFSYANIAGIYGWSSVTLTGVNIYNVRNSLPGFRDRAKSAGAVEMRSWEDDVAMRQGNDSERFYIGCNNN